ncbi:helix-turn-helix domain-containing protein [Sphingomonas montanisoli]|nr:helix-turn-helix domain-containing protein [Sphingomonas montanisoli]
MEDDQKAEKDGSIRAISRAIAVLQAINRNGALTLTEIADNAGIPHPTATRIVRTLLEERLIEREPSRKRYRPTALIQTLSCGFQNHDRLVSISRPHITRLTRLIDWPISVVTRVGQAMVVRDSTSALTSLTFNNYYPGWQVPLLPSSSGRVYFAFASPDEQEELLKAYRVNQRGVDNLTLREFESGEATAKIRRQGYAAATRTQYSANPGKTSSMAVPIFEGEHLLGALTMVFFANALSIPDAIRRFLEPLKDCAKAIGDEMAAAE